jgi:tripartite-type tricarboxylate transporter receptor subunit TctC
MNGHACTFVLAGLLAANTALVSPVSAQSNPVAAFFEGKSISMIIPSGTGGGYDRYGRLVGRHIGRFIPGNPNIVPQNMPGAGGIVAANYLYNVAPKDGTAISIIQNGVPFKKLLDPRQLKYDISGFRWLGSVSPAANIAITTANNKETSLKSLKIAPLIVGASGGTTLDLPVALNSVLDLKLNVVKGYKSTNDILLAMERNEVGGMVGIDYSSFIGSTKGRSDSYRILFQMGLARHTALPNVPLAQEIANNENERAVLEVIFSSFAIGRSFVTLDIPADRLAAIRAAFFATMKDDQFLAEAEKSGAEVDPLTPEQIDKIIAAVYSKPAEVISQARKLLPGGD